MTNPNAKLNPKLLIITMAFIIVIGAGYGVIQYLGGKPSETSIIEMPVGEQKIITIEGEIVCLPGKSGRNSLECAIGLLGEDGNYYGLKNLSQDDIISGKYPTGKRVEISGVFTADENKISRYNITGTIDVTEIIEKLSTKIENSENTDLPREIFKHWVHSRKEDTKDTKVFRPSDYNLPPSRGGGDGFDIKKDGKIVLYSPGPDDRLVELQGYWKSKMENEIIVYLGNLPPYTIHIISLNNDVLKIKK